MPVEQLAYGYDPDFVSPGDGAAHNAVTVTLAPNNTYSVRCRVIARGLTDGLSAMMEKQAIVKSVSGGNLALVGAVVTLFTAQGDTGTGTWAVNFSLSGLGIVVSVTGSASQRVAWSFLFEVYGFTNVNVAGVGEIP
jgi:hypothetical protein